MHLQEAFESCFFKDVKVAKLGDDQEAMVLLSEPEVSAAFQVSFEAAGLQFNYEALKKSWQDHLDRRSS